MTASQQGASVGSPTSSKYQTGGQASASPGGPPTWLLFMRHASHDNHKLTVPGVAESGEVGQALKEVLPQLSSVSLDQVRIVHATSGEATETATNVGTKLGQPTGVAEPLLNPDAVNPYTGVAVRDPKVDAVAEVTTKIVAVQGDVVVVIGHLPLLAWIIKPITGKALPMARAELLAIKRTSRDGAPLKGVFSWALTPGSQADKLIPELRDKIKSKMEAAKFLATFVTATLGFQLGFMFEAVKVTDAQRSLGPVWSALLGGAAILLALSAGLFFVTIFAYDKLLMPKSLWADQRPGPGARPTWLVWRPPSSAHWILLQNMQRVWAWIFTPATIVLLAALLLETGILFVPRVNLGVALPIALGVLVIVGASVVFIFRLAWPRLGSED